MLTIGAHLSASKGYTAMLNQALEIGANTFQFFTRNPRGGSAKAIDENDVKKIEDLIDDLNKSKESDNLEEIESKMKVLSEEISKISAEVYSKQNVENNSDFENSTHEEADFEEVKREDSK